MNNNYDVNDQKFFKTTEKVREQLLKEFDELEKKKDTITELDLSYALSRDRKAALILKSLQMDLQKEIACRKIGRQIKQIEQS